jgi:hypothetical protein
MSYLPLHRAALLPGAGELQVARRPGRSVTSWERFLRCLIYHVAVDRGDGGTRNAKRLGSFAQIQRLDPEHPAVATRARGEGLHRSDIDIRLPQFLHNFSDRAWPVLTLNQKAGLFLAQLKASFFGRVSESGRVFGNQVQLGSARTMGNAEMPSRLIPS